MEDRRVVLERELAWFREDLPPPALEVVLRREERGEEEPDRRYEPEQPDVRELLLAFFIDRRHGQYAGALPPQAMLEIVRRSSGQSGANRDYVIATVRALEELGYRETALHLLAQRLAGTHEASADSKAA